MRMARIAVRNISRNKLRTVLTMLAMAVVIITFVMLRTVLSSWMAASEHAAKDRIGIRNKVSFIMPLPRRYAQEIQQMEGVVHVAHMNWFGGKDPNRQELFFPTMAVVPEDFLTVYDEILVPEEQKQNWFNTKTGALIGDSLAKQTGWKVGDRITLKGTIFQGDWEMTISGIYTATRKSVDRSSLWFHYDYFNEGPIPDPAKDQVGWIVARVDNPSRSADIARAIDAHFEESDLQTLSMSERAMNNSFLGMFSAVLKALDLVSAIILFIMVLILGNTIAMGVRERTHEYGVLRAIGFLPKHLSAFVYGEAATLSCVGGVIGVVLSYLLIGGLLGPALEDNFGQWFPFFRIEPQTIVIALVLSAVLGLIAAVIPARSVARLKVVDSLRTTG